MVSNLAITVPHRVLLPRWIFDKAKGDENEINRLVVDYMARYPNYKVREISNGFAVCERFEGFF